MVRDDRRQSVARGLRVIKMPIAVRLQPHGELVKVFGDLVVVVKIFVVINFVITIQIVQANNLIAAGYVDFLINDLKAERLEETGRDTSPPEVLGGESAHQPNFAEPGANSGGVGVGKKIESTEAHPRIPRVHGIGRERE